MPPDLRGLRVLTFCDYFSEESSGGAERVAAETARRLKDWGADVLVVSACPDRLMVGASSPGVARFRSFELSGLVGAQVSIAPRLGHRLRTELERFRPNVLHAHGLHFQSSRVAARLTKVSRVPLVTTVHLGGPEHLLGAVRAATSFYDKTFGRHILNRSRHVVSVSSAVDDHVREIGVDEGHRSVVPNGVDHDVFFPRTRTDGELPQIAFVGRLIANKGPLLFVDALCELARRGVRFRATIIGEGPLRRETQAAIARDGLTGDVGLTGHVSNVADYLRDAHIVVRPSTTEGMPLTVLEAMATEACVVASDVPGNRGLIGDDERGLLFPVGNASAFADKLELALTDSALRSRLAAAGRELALTYSWDRCAAETAAVLQAAR